MPEMRETQCAELNAKSAQDYAEWLLGGFKDWYVPEYRHTAFRPIQFLLSPSGPSLWEQLASVHDQLSSIGRCAFEDGLGQAIVQCPRRDAWARVLWQLVHLGVRIRANKMISPLNDVLKENYLTNRASEEARDCFARVVNILCSYQGERRVVNLWRYLLSHGKLPPNDAPLLFLALCRHDCARFPEYLQWGQNHFDQLIRAGITDFPRAMLTRFAQIAPLTTVASRLRRLRLLNYGRLTPLQADNWFLKALVAESWSPCQLRNDGDQFKIRLRDGDWSVVAGPKRNTAEEDRLYGVLQMMAPLSFTAANHGICNHLWSGFGGSFAQDQQPMDLDLSDTQKTGLTRLVSNLMPSGTRCIPGSIHIHGRT